MAQALLKVKRRLAYEKITQNYRSCKNPIEKTRWHLIWLMANPQKSVSVKEAAKTVNFCQRWARTLVNRYNEEGSKGLIDKRKNNKGQEPVLNKKQKKELRKIILSGKPPDKGLWTSVKVANWIEEKTGKRPSNKTGLNYLSILGFTLQEPRPRHTETASEEEIKQFKKN